MKALRLLASVLLLATPAQAQFSGTSAQSGAGGNPQIPDTSMCATPPTTFAHVWYIDPNAANGGDGTTPATAWNSLQAVSTTVTGHGFSTPLLTSAGGGPVASGDEILLMNGTATQYGALGISTINNSSFVTIAAAPGQTPTLLSLGLANSSKFAFAGIAVQNTGIQGASHLLNVGDSGALFAHDITFDHMTVSSQTDVSSWTQSVWLSTASQGVSFFRSKAGGTYCISMTNSHMFNLINAVAFASDNSTFMNNEIDHTGVDFIDYGADNIIISLNYLHDLINLSGGAHVDYMQGLTGGFSEFHDILIDSNTCIEQVDPNLPFIGLPLVINGGIGTTNQDWTRIVVTNNVVAVRNHAIGGSSWHDSVIAGNITVMGSIIVNDHSNEGRSTTNLVVRNNITDILDINAIGSIVDHNVVTNHSTSSGIYINGIFTFFSSPGTHGDHNLVDTGGITSEITTFDNTTTFTYDFHLLQSGGSCVAPACGYGANTMPTPAVDITGFPRSATHDVGAYTFH